MCNHFFTTLFAQRIIKPEKLDHLPAEEARPNLADLVRINRRFGGHSVIRKAMAQVVNENDRFTLLDIGAASGDTARLIRGIYPGASVTSLDHSSTNMEAAPQPKLLGDAFQLPFRNGSFDVVMSSLFLHHFTNEQVTDLLRAFYAVARRALLICDLERSIFPYLFLATTKKLLGWHDVTVHDGLISVRAAFRGHELREVARKAGIANAKVETHRPAFRLAMVARKA
ncbi:MAG TPA: methyltransferase domain-containing protein [Terriglobia bacterium]|nr:methyltransferase domain-containing protein [Terriglobia bacterium]